MLSTVSHQLPPGDSRGVLKSNQNTSDEGSEATGWDSALHHTLGVYALNAESSCREVLWDQRWMCAGQARGRPLDRWLSRVQSGQPPGRRRGWGARAVGLSLALGRTGWGTCCCSGVSGVKAPGGLERASVSAMGRAGHGLWDSGLKPSAPAWKCGLLPARWGVPGPSWGGWVLQGGSFLGLGVRRSGGRRSGWT